jgi:hypothetical protein
LVQRVGYAVAELKQDDSGQQRGNHAAPLDGMWAISPIAKTIATSPRTLVAASSEWARVARNTASWATAKSALIAANRPSHTGVYGRCRGGTRDGEV